MSVTINNITIPDVYHWLEFRFNDEILHTGEKEQYSDTIKEIMSKSTSHENERRSRWMFTAFKNKHIEMDVCFDTKEDCMTFKDWLFEKHENNLVFCEYHTQHTFDLEFDRSLEDKETYIDQPIQDYWTWKGDDLLEKFK